MRPIGEGLAYERVDKVDEPLTRELTELFCVWQVVRADVTVLRLLEHLLDAETFVLGQ